MGKKKGKRATGDRHTGEREQREGTTGKINRLPEVSGTAPVSPV